MLSVTMDVAKKSFFDRKIVLDRTDAATVRVHSRFGAYTRTSAQRSIRYRDKPSQPGSPPSAHRTVVRVKTSKKTGVKKPQTVSPLREYIFFAQDISGGNRSVLIGPTLLSGRGGSMVLLALEKGGSSVIQSLGKKRQVTIRARPYMLPAFNENLKKLPSLWAGAIKK